MGRIGVIEAAGRVRPVMAKPPVLTPQAEDFPRWYQDVVSRAELAENGPVRGTMVIRPYAYAIWERMQADVDRRIKATGAENAYFPLFIPESYLQREADHVEGFAPELAVVTHAGGKELAEPIVVRPTSETVIGEYMAKWIQSYRDLPLLLNQWANVVRWELRPRVFLRTTEFLWQEGHCAHATQADGHEYASRILNEVYADFMEEELALPVLRGIKPPSERFAGAINSMTVEAMMGDGKALQMGTSHELGQNFARAFDIDFVDDEGNQRLCWTTSWGVTTRMIGGLIMGHGDDRGLRIPPRIAATQVVVMVVRDDDAGSVTDAARRLVAQLIDGGVRARLDAAVQTGFGRRATDWELKGVPIRIELGPRDVEGGVATIAQRQRDGKSELPLSGLAAAIGDLLDLAQVELWDQALRRRAQHSVDVDTVADAIEAASTGFARIPWAALCETVDGRTGEDRLGDQAVTVRCLQRPDGGLPVNDSEPDLMAWVARSY